MSTIAASNSCVWLMAVGGKPARNDFASTCVFLELSEWLNEKQTSKQKHVMSTDIYFIYYPPVYEWMGVVEDSNSDWANMLLPYSGSA